MSRSVTIDKTFLFIVIFLVILGYVFFLSAAMGIYAKDSEQFGSLAFKQGFFGILLGFLFLFISTKINYKIYKKYALIFFIASMVLTLAVFIPGVGASINGAKRWISIAGFSFQPVAILNLGFIIYWAAWLAYVKEKVTTFTYGIFPLIVILSGIGGILLFQPDTDSFLIMAVTGCVMYLIAGGRPTHILIILVAGIITVSSLVYQRPYLMARFTAFFNPGEHSQTIGYQLQQSLIAVGSGQFSGRGLGQSVQKYKFLPESISDSIFAVAAEEIGFVGCISILVILLFFGFRGLRIAINSPDNFSGLMVSGIVILILVSSFVNISSTLGIIPFSGIPLAFFSQGGTFLMVTLIQMGIILNVSKYNKHNA